MNPSVRTRLAATYGGLFLLAGGILLMLNYLFVENRLPAAQRFAAARVGEQPAPEGSEAVYVAPATRSEELSELINSVQEYRDSALNTLLLQSGVALLIAAVLAVVLGWLVAGRALRPVRAITATARKLGARNLERRIELDGPSDELKELADTFDDMLDRLSAAFESQRRFIANASHELRTPLAAQRTVVEVALTDPQAPPEVRRLGEQVLRANERNERLIEGLLALARSDRGVMRRGPVRLDELVDTVLASESESAKSNGVSMHNTLLPRTVTGDRVLLEQLVRNMVRNAIHYNVLDGSVTVEIRDTEPDTVTLGVTNTGPEVSTVDIPALFEPFRRLSTDRVTESSGAGLGLPIVNSVATAHHGTVRAEPGPAGGLSIEVDLQRQHDAQAEAVS